IAGLRGEDSIAEVCRREGINQNLYYRWSKDFLEAGKKRPAGDTAREATSGEVKGLRAETQQLKELMIENLLLKEAYSGMGSPIHDVKYHLKFPPPEHTGLLPSSPRRKRDHKK